MQKQTEKAECCHRWQPDVVMEFAAVFGLRRASTGLTEKPIQRLLPLLELPGLRLVLPGRSGDEVAGTLKLLERGFTVPKHRTFFMTLYGGGLRLNEACHLKAEHIDSARC